MTSLAIFLKKIDSQIYNLLSTILGSLYLKLHEIKQNYIFIVLFFMVVKPYLH